MTPIPNFQTEMKSTSLQDDCSKAKPQAQYCLWIEPKISKGPASSWQEATYLDSVAQGES